MYPSGRMFGISDNIQINEINGRMKAKPTRLQSNSPTDNLPCKIPKMYIAVLRESVFNIQRPTAEC